MQGTILGFLMGFSTLAQIPRFSSILLIMDLSLDLWGTWIAIIPFRLAVTLVAILVPMVLSTILVADSRRVVRTLERGESARHSPFTQAFSLIILLWAQMVGIPMAILLSLPDWDQPPGTWGLGADQLSAWSLILPLVICNFFTTWITLVITHRHQDRMTRRIHRDSKDWRNKLLFLTTLSIAMQMGPLTAWWLNVQTDLNTAMIVLISYCVALAGLFLPSQLQMRKSRVIVAGANQARKPSKISTAPQIWLDGTPLADDLLQLRAVTGYQRPLLTRINRIIPQPATCQNLDSLKLWFRETYNGWVFSFSSHNPALPDVFVRLWNWEELMAVLCTAQTFSRKSRLRRLIVRSFPGRFLAWAMEFINPVVRYVFLWTAIMVGAVLVVPLLQTWGWVGAFVFPILILASFFFMILRGKHNLTAAFEAWKTFIPPTQPPKSERELIGDFLRAVVATDVATGGLDRVELIPLLVAGNPRVIRLLKRYGMTKQDLQEMNLQETAERALQEYESWLGKFLVTDQPKTETAPESVGPQAAPKLPITPAAGLQVGS
jgi:hypothetical protein